MIDALNKDKKIKLITHNDLDGVGCAILFREAFGKDNVDITYSDVYSVDSHMRELIDTGEIDTYSLIAITDLAPKIGMCKEIEERYKHKVIVLDHHRSRLKELEGIGGWCSITTHDSNGVAECGTHLVYKYLYNKISNAKRGKIEELVAHIRSYDTWDWVRSNNEKARELNIILDAVGVDEFVNRLYGFNEDFETERYRVAIEIWDNINGKLLRDKIKHMREFELEGIKMGFIFWTGENKGYIADILLDTRKDLDAMIIINPDNDNIGMYTNFESVPVLGIMERLGGGGHIKACGGKLNLKIPNYCVSSIENMLAK